MKSSRLLGKACLLGLAAAALLVSAPAMAASYVFSYSYDAGNVVTGSFSGQNEAGGLVGDISNIKVQLNGQEIPTGPLSAWFHTDPGCANCYVNSGAVASANFFDNNFFFTDGDATGVNPAKPEQGWFYIIPWNDGAGIGTQYFVAPNSYVNYDNNGVNPPSWSLNQVAGVPEPSAWILLIAGFGLVGFALRRSGALATIA